MEAEAHQSRRSRAFDGRREALELAGIFGCIERYREIEKDIIAGTDTIKLIHRARGLKPGSAQK